MTIQTTNTTVCRVQANGETVVYNDLLAAEQPLEIQLSYVKENRRTIQSLAVTMRTPGHDQLLATGFLFTEGIIGSGSAIKKIDHIKDGTLLVMLAADKLPQWEKLQRNFFTSSSCGVCGKASIDAVFSTCPQYPMPPAMLVPPNIIMNLPQQLARQQAVFEATGGLHAAALFTTNGVFLYMYEDVGRHNALDKLIGNAVEQATLPLSQHILLLSGRASFELVQKAAMAGIQFICAVGAPSGMAVQLAEEFDITLIGFLRDARFNIYTGTQRVIV